MGCCCSSKPEQTTMDFPQRDPPRPQRIFSEPPKEAIVVPINLKAPETPERKIVYKSVKGDDIDERMASIINNYKVELAIIRIYEGKYLIGTEARQCTIKGSQCIVRVGGGYEALEHYLLRVQEQEIEKIKKIMADQNKDYIEVMKDLLTKYKAEQVVISNAIRVLQQQAVAQAMLRAKNNSQSDLNANSLTASMSPSGK